MIKTVIYDSNNTLFYTRAAIVARYSDVPMTLGLGPLTFESMTGPWG